MNLCKWYLTKKEDGQYYLCVETHSDKGIEKNYCNVNVDPDLKFCTDNSGAKIYLNKEGHIHRDGDLPAFELEWKKEWYQHGFLHRVSGPAEITFFPSSDRMPKYEWYINGLRHRENGPAIEDPAGYQGYFLYGIEYNKEDFNYCIQNKKLMEKLKNNLKENETIKKTKI